MELLVKRKASRVLDCSSSSSTKRRKVVDSACLIDDLLPTDIMSSIFQKLNYIDLVRSRAVSSYWNSIAEDVQIFPSPCLLLPSKEEVDGGDGTYVNNNVYSCFLKLGESQVCSLKRIPIEFRESCCVGSSNGWLVFLGDQAIPSLLHPFKQVKIQLPSLLDVLCLKRLERNLEGDYEVKHEHLEEYYTYTTNTYSIYTKQQLRSFVQKVVLIGEPDHNNKNFGVVILCKYNHNSSYIIVYYRGGDSLLRCTSLYTGVLTVDVIWHENHLYVLKDEGTDIEIWDWEDHAFLTKKTNIILHFPPNVEDYFRDLCITRFYLIESCENIMLVVRLIGEYVDSYGTPVDADDLDILPDNVYPYLTCLFYVYKLDRHNCTWVKIESLDDHVFFVGGNQSVSVSLHSFPNGEKDSIYYTDDYWDRMEEDYLYGGHDMGIYNLKDKYIKPIYEFSSDKILPPPHWIVPNLKP